MHINVSGLLRNFASVRRAALAGETVVIATRDGNLVLSAQPEPPSGAAEGAGDRPDAALVLAPARATASPLRASAGEPRPAGTIELADVLLRIDLETGDLVGFEVPHACRFLAKQHLSGEDGEDLHVRHQEPQHTLWRHTLRRAEAALIAPASSALGALV